MLTVVSASPFHLFHSSFFLCLAPAIGGGNTTSGNICRERYRRGGGGRYGAAEPVCTSLDARPSWQHCGLTLWYAGLYPGPVDTQPGEWATLSPHLLPLPALSDTISLSACLCWLLPLLPRDQHGSEVCNTLKAQIVTCGSSVESRSTEKSSHLQPPWRRADKIRVWLLSWLIFFSQTQYCLCPIQYLHTKIPNPKRFILVRAEMPLKKHLYQNTKTLHSKQE